MENQNQPAFPTHHNGHVGGLTKREYFAGLAMQGMVGSADYYKPEIYQQYAECAVKQADALLTELGKGGA